jgi:hypothetical protein
MTSSILSFSPSSLSNCVQWLDATDITTLFQNSSGTTPVTANGQSVAFWRDKSGSNNSVFQSGSIPVPGYSTILIGGQPGLDFTNSSLLRSSDFQNSSNVTTFVVGTVRNTITNWGVFWGHFTTTDHDNYISIRNVAGTSFINWHTANDNSVMNLAFTVDSPVIYYGIMSNRFTTFFSQTNTGGTTTVSGNVGATIVPASIPTWVGQSRIQAEAVRSYISEIIYYQRVLTTFEQQQVQGYLAWKYNLQTFLPSTNPYRNFPFLIVPESVPRSIPSSAFLVPINTYSSIKTFTLPTVSTNPGRLLILKDYLGYAATNNIRISTLGLDRIERSNVSSMTLSNDYGAYWFQNDGITNWFLTDAYLNTAAILQPTPPWLPGVYVKTYANTGSIPNSNGPATSAGSSGNWGALLTTTFVGSPYNGSNTPGGSSVFYYGNNFGVFPSGNGNFSYIARGSFFSATSGTIQFIMETDDGMRVDFNNVNVLNQWQQQGQTGYTSAVLSLPAGYTPLLVRWYDTGGGGASLLRWSINGGGYTSNGTGVLFYAQSNITQV